MYTRLHLYLFARAVLIKAASIRCPGRALRRRDPADLFGPRAVYAARGLESDDGKSGGSCGAGVSSGRYCDGCSCGCGGLDEGRFSEEERQRA
jgi:hypothetical protein